MKIKPKEGTIPNSLEILYLKVKLREPYEKEIQLSVGILPEVYVGLEGFRPIAKLDCDGYNTNWGTWETIYSGNNGQYQYDDNGAMILNDVNPVPFLKIEDTTSFNNEYSAYLTVQTDNMNQAGQNGNNEDVFGYTIASIGDASPSGKDYLAWVCIYKNWLQVYSYYQGAVLMGYNQEGITKVTNQYGNFEVASYDISKYKGQIINIQVIGVRNGDTKVYINGKIQEAKDENGNNRTSFKSGTGEVIATQVMIGDLRPLRNLKFRGKLYDFEVYGYALSENEIMWNWECARNKWINRTTN